MDMGIFPSNCVGRELLSVKSKYHLRGVNVSSLDVRLKLLRCVWNVLQLKVNISGISLPP